MVSVIRVNGCMLPLSWWAKNKNFTLFLCQTRGLLFFILFVSPCNLKKGLKILTPIWANSHMFGIHRIPWQITKTKKKWKLYIFLRIVKIKECKDVTNKLGVNGTTCNYCNRNFCKFYFTLMQGSSKQKFMKENIFDGCFIMKK